MTVRERKRRRRKTEKLVRLTVVLMLLALLGSGGYVYAKYFSEGAQYGVAIASGVYLTANYAAEITSQEDDYFEMIAVSNYIGGATNFTFQVRNYENFLLFNESGVEIPYSLRFWLGKEPENANYTVSWTDTDGTSKQLTLNSGESNAVTITNRSIGGGRAYADEYTIAIAPTNSSKHKPVPIYVEVKTEEGALVDKTLRGKMVLSGNSSTLNYISYQGFATTENIDSDEAKFTEIQGQSMLTYEVRTVGEMASDEITEKLKLSWDPTILQINLYDDAYTAWQEKEAEAGAKPTTPYKETVTAEDGSTQERYYITMDVMPYSSQTVNFFRASEYADKIKSLSDLENETVIWAEKIVE